MQRDELYLDSYGPRRRAGNISYETQNMTDGG